MDKGWWKGPALSSGLTGPVMRWYDVVIFLVVMGALFMAILGPLLWATGVW